MEVQTNKKKQRNALLMKNEKEANVLVAKVMRICFLLFTIVFILNCVGVFVVDQKVMTIAYILGSCFMLLPTLLSNILKINKDYLKYLYVLSAVLFVFILCTTLTFHVVVMYTFAIAVASLYFSKRLNIYTTVLSVIGCSLGQIMAFQLQTLPDDNFPIFQNMIIYGVLPRAICLIAISAIFTTLTRRTATMLGNLMGAEEQKQMLDSLSKMKQKSAQVSDQLVSLVSELSTISDMSNETNQSIAQETGNILHSSSDNASNVENVNRNMKEISEQLEQVNAMSEQIKALSKKAKEATLANEKSMDHAAASMEQIYKSANECKEIVTNLGNESQEIIGIVNVITGISSKTNILALNASIEAARAGEHGKGFSVVAEEIQKLAEQTKSAVESIGTIIRGVVDSTGEAVVAMDESVDLTQTGLKEIKEAEVSSNVIASSNTEMAEHINSMNEITKQVYQSGLNVKDSMNQVSQNTHKNLGAVEQVTAATQENSASIENIADMVSQINDIVKELNDIIQ